MRASSLEKHANLENMCIVFINMHCAKVSSPVAGLLLPCKKIPQSRVVKKV